MSRRQQWLLWFVLFTAIGLAFVSYRYLDDLARGYHGTFEVHFIEEMTGSYTAAVVIPLASFLTRRFPWGRAWVALFAAHLGAAAVFSGIHTSLMAFTRVELFAALHLGAYDYGLMSYRYPMEFSHDLIVYGVVAGFMYVWQRMRAEQLRALDAVRLRAELVETRLANLQLQLHPHFLFNSLNAISAVMYEDPQAADTMLVRLSEYLRMTLDASDKLETEVKDELRMTASYVDIMRARFEQRLRLRVTCEPGVGHALVPSMLLQPLVENAILHGGMASSEGLAIDVDVRREGDDLAIAVVDTGTGLPDDMLVVEGRGLGATRSRLEQRYGPGAQLTIANRPEARGTRVGVRLPLHLAARPAAMGTVAASPALSGNDLPPLLANDAR